MHPTLHCHSQACHCQAGVCCLWRTFRDKQRLLVVWLKKTLVNLIEAQVKGFLGLVLRFLSPKPPSYQQTHNHSWAPLQELDQLLDSFNTTTPMLQKPGPEALPKRAFDIRKFCSTGSKQDLYLKESPCNFKKVC